MSILLRRSRATQNRRPPFTFYSSIFQSVFCVILIVGNCYWTTRKKRCLFGLYYGLFCFGPRSRGHVLWLWGMKHHNRALWWWCIFNNKTKKSLNQLWLQLGLRWLTMKKIVRYSERRNNNKYRWGSQSLPIWTSARKDNTCQISVANL